MSTAVLTIRNSCLPGLGNSLLVMALEGTVLYPCWQPAGLVNRREERSILGYVSWWFLGPDTSG